MGATESGVFALARRRKITDAKVEEVITKTLESAPRDATHWSTRSMAAEVGLNQTAVARIWRAFGLQAPTAEPYGRSYTNADCEGHRWRFMNAGQSRRGSARRSCRKRGAPFDVTVETAT